MTLAQRELARMAAYMSSLQTAFMPVRRRVISRMKFRNLNHTGDTWTLELECGHFKKVSGSGRGGITKKVVCEECSKRKG